MVKQRVNAPASPDQFVPPIEGYWEAAQDNQRQEHTEEELQRARQEALELSRRGQTTNWFLWDQLSREKLSITRPNEPAYLPNSVPAITVVHKDPRFSSSLRSLTVHKH